MKKNRRCRARAFSHTIIPTRASLTALHCDFIKNSLSDMERGFPELVAPTLAKVRATLGSTCIRREL